MQNAGQQYGQGAATSHPGTPYGHSETSSSSTGSITSSLRQFRKKDVDKQQVNDTTSATTGESHVARVAPHNHYPPRTNENYRYPPQFPDYSLMPQMKYSEISNPLQESVPPSVIQKPKAKDYMEVCNVQQQPHMKQGYPDQLNGQQYASDSNLHPHHQYPHKDHQIHSLYKPESQYFPKEPQYQQLTSHQMQKYNMQTQMRKYPPENDFLSKLRRIHPSMARSIMSDHHLQESQGSYQPMEQNRMYPHQNQRYMNYTAPLQANPYPHNYIPPQNYPNYPPSCSYNRPSQIAPRFPPINPHERSISPRRSYSENLIPPMNYATLPQKISPSYPQYNTPEYAQHYQHRRAPQEYYQQHCRSTQYLPHQMTQQEITESRVTVSDSIKQYIENWADEDTASEINQLENSRLCKDTLRVREDQSTETVYMINASELQYLENGIPLVTSENGIPLVTSENGQYIIKSGVAIDNTTGMVRIMDKGNQSDTAENGERIVNLHIMDAFKPDCMLANKPNELNQRPQESLLQSADKPKVVIHQNAIIQPSQQPVFKEVLEAENKAGGSLPIITDSDITHETDPLDKFEETIFKECKKETADKNCSPINVEEMEALDNFQDHMDGISVICATESLNQSIMDQDAELDDASKLKNMPIIELMTADVRIDKTEESIECEDKKSSGEMKMEGDLAGIKEEFEKGFLPKKEGNNVKDEHVEIIENTETTDESLTENNTKKEEVKTEENIEKVEVEEQAMQFDNCLKNEEVIKENIGDEKDVTENVENIDINKVDEGLVEENREPQFENIPEAIKNDGEVQETGHKEKIDNKEDVFTNTDQTDILNSENVTSELKTDKPKRSKRIFSVDDIINNIGTNLNKTKSETDLSQRRRSLQTTREFLEKEIDFSNISDLKPIISENRNHDELVKNGEPDEKDVADPPVQEKCEESVKPSDSLTESIENTITQNKETTDDRTEATLEVTEDTIPKTNEAIIPHNVENSEVAENVVTETKDTADDCTEDAKDETCNTNTNLAESETNLDLNISNTNNHSPPQNLVQSSTENCEEKPDNITNDISSDKSHNSLDTDIPASENPVENIETCEKPIENISTCEAEPEITSVLTVDETSTNNEVHFRNAIRVEENNVLLEIAGELVEINVITVNGKKVITVVPLSETTVVDCNDNYETVENNDEIDTQAKSNSTETIPVDTVTGVVPAEDVVPETDVIETTSEIIIGMDISLEEEIQLDLEKPAALCTKAAKKSYENDLQIPSITTSEDINDENKTDSYDNDKVSSSKEQVKEKKENGSDTIHSSSKTDEIKETKKSREKRDGNSNKNALKDLLKVRKTKKTEMRVKANEEFIPFKDIVKTRSVKKQKLQHQKSSENVTADSTNKIEHEESNQNDCDPKEKKDKEEDKVEDGDKSKLVEDKISESKVKTRSQKNYRKPSISEEKIEELPEKRENIEDKTEELLKTDISKVNSSTGEQSDIVDKNKETSPRKVTPNTTDCKKLDVESKPSQPQPRNYKLEDPRLKRRPSANVVVPSVSEILKENAVVENGKKKLSLEEYNRRKRKLSAKAEEAEVKAKKINIQEKASPKESPVTKVNSIVEKTVVERRRFVLHRPKSLEDPKPLDSPRDGILARRKFSLEESSNRPNYLDWEDTQSPKTNLTSQDKSQKRLREFSGLIDNNKSKTVIDINGLRLKPAVSENDEVLQTYKEQVDSKLSSLNIQIPRIPKPSNPFSTSETNNLIERFLNNEKITIEEMEKIKRIISYKRMMQQLNKIKPPDAVNPTLNPSYEVRKDADKDMKLHLKKVPDKKKKKRFMNLYSESTSESGSDVSENKDTTGDYSVVQSECIAPAGVPKLIIKRKTEMPLPVVRLERLDLDLLVAKKRKTY